MVERDRRLSLRISDDEWAKVHSLAELEGVSVSDYVRLFIRRNHEAAVEAKRIPKPKK